MADLKPHEIAREIAQKLKDRIDTREDFQEICDLVQEICDLVGSVEARHLINRASNEPKLVN